MKTKALPFFDADAAGAQLGLSSRHLFEVSMAAGVTPHNFGIHKNKPRWKWDQGMIDKIRHHRETTPKYVHKTGRRRGKYE
jgi:hypothetical protein